jgi:hypothetical protein
MDILKELVWKKSSSTVPYRRLIVGQKKKQVCYSSYLNTSHTCTSVVILRTTLIRGYFVDSPGRLCMSVHDYYCYKF